MEDQFPGKPKILFVGFANSTHTRSWIDLLKGQEINLRVFGVEKSTPPESFKIPTYCYKHIFKGHYSKASAFKKVWIIISKVFVRILVKLIGQERSVFFVSKCLGPENSLWLFKKYFSADIFEEKWLAIVVNNWKPDIIHTLGLDPASFLYFRVKKRFSLAESGKWVVTARGGPELALKRLVPDNGTKIKEVLCGCDQFIADNQHNYKYAVEHGLAAHKQAAINVTPGTGGVDINELSALRQTPAHESRIILYPKAYECPASKALPVFEALCLCWEKIMPCEVYLTAIGDETKMWFQTLPRKIRDACRIMDRIPRNELLKLMARSRIMLAPSLSDGVPNTLYEAMATGSFPIVSPLNTIQEIVKNEENVLFARNLYPQEIADAIVMAMTDDELVESSIKRNYETVKKIADKKAISQKVIQYYKGLM